MEKTKQTINEERQRFREEFQLPEFKVDLAGRAITYFEMPKECNLELENFAYQNTTGNPQDGYIIGVSEGVKRDFQPFWAFHEFVEFMEIGKNVQGRCKKAVEIELKILPGRFLPDYLRLRTKFFNDLVRYAKEHNYDADSLREFRASRDYLNKLMRNKYGK
jgi:hypothetical protein